MKNFIAMIALLAFSTLAFAELSPNLDPGKHGLPTQDHVRDYLNLGYGFDPQLGVQITDHKTQLIKGMWSVVTNGGASVLIPAGLGANVAPPDSSTILANLKDVDGKDVYLPYHAVIKQVTVDVVAGLSAPTDPKFSAPFLGVGIDKAADLFAFTKYNSWTGIMAGVPVGTAATMHKVGLGVPPPNRPYGESKTQGSTVKLNMKGGSVIGGQVNVFIEYYLSD